MDFRHGVRGQERVHLGRAARDDASERPYGGSLRAPGRGNETVKRGMRIAGHHGSQGLPPMLSRQYAYG
jgi:hypothetical protein